jgi:hypothetical protein
LARNHLLWCGAGLLVLGVLGWATVPGHHTVPEAEARGLRVADDQPSAALPGCGSGSDMGSASEGEVWRDAAHGAVNCLYLILRLHHVDASYRDAERALPSAARTGGLVVLRDAAAAFGLHGRIVRTTPAALSHGLLPAVAHVEEEKDRGGRLVIVTAANADRVEFIDAATAVLQDQPAWAFQKRWTGYLLRFEPPTPWRFYFPAVAALGGLSVLLGLWRRRPRAGAPTTGGATSASLPTVLLLVAVALPAARSADKPARPEVRQSAAEVAAAVARSRSGLVSLLAEFEWTRRDPETDRPGGPVHVTAAARGPRRFTDTRHAADGLPPALDLERNQVWLDPDRILAYYPARRVATARAKGKRDEAWRQRAWEVQRVPVFECLAWWPPDDTQPPAKLDPKQEAPFFLHQALARPGYRVRPLQERVDGTWCVVLERPGVDTCWFDPAHGFALRRREFHPTAANPVFLRYELGDYRREDAGVWLPRTLRRQVCRTDGPGDTAHPAVIGDEAGTVLRWQVNDVPADLFTFRPPAGTLLDDLTTGRRCQVPGGLAFLDEVSDLAAARAAALAPPTDTAPPEPDDPPWRVPVLVVGGVILIALDLGCLLARRGDPS